MDYQYYILVKTIIIAVNFIINVKETSHNITHISTPYMMTNLVNYIKVFINYYYNKD
jgi:hypothetical protein